MWHESFADGFVDCCDVRTCSQAKRDQLHSDDEDAVSPSHELHQPDFTDAVTGPIEVTKHEPDFEALRSHFLFLKPDIIKRT